MNISVLAVSVLSLSCAMLSTPALASNAKLHCSVIESTDAKSAYQLRVSNPSKKAVPSGATVHAKIAPKKLKGVNPKTVNTDFTSTLKQDLSAGGSTDIEGTPFAKTCTANATW